MTNPIVEKDRVKFGREANIVLSIFSLLVAAILYIWYNWDEEWLSNADDLIYNLGLIGGLMMLLQFVYSARKRVQKMRSWGNLKVWFAVHAFIGLGAPIIIIIHSRFDIESINGGVAFFAMLLVVISGVVGRYLYSQVSFDLVTSREELKTLHQQLQQRIIKAYPLVATDVEQPLKVFMVQAFVAPRSIAEAFRQSMVTGVKSRVLYWQLCQLQRPGATGGGGQMTMDTPVSVPLFTGDEKKLLKRYLVTLSKLARFNAFKMLFSLWRVGHVPVIYLLL
ncbi:MAG: hypothetical protein OEZ58_03785, partial [Gammaproteobacteria bacterium]|nr:hypothetical protein [Gammaproteobacteria bacterium]